MEYIFYSKLTTPLDKPIEKPSDLSDELWRVGKVHNPNPYLYCPVVVKSFQALEERSKFQKTAILSNKQRLFMIMNKLEGFIAVNEDTLKKMVTESMANIKRLNSLMSSLLSKLYASLFKNKNLEYNELNKLQNQLGVYEGMLVSIEELYINTASLSGVDVNRDFEIENTGQVVGNIKSCGELIDKLYLKFEHLKNEINIIKKEKEEAKMEYL